MSYPSSLVNIGGEEAIQDLKKTMSEHLLNNGAEEVSFCDALDDKNNRKCEFITFVHHTAQETLTDFSTRALPGVKFIDVGHGQMVKSKLSNQNLKKSGVKPCCYLKTCIPKVGSTSKCGAMERMYKNRGGVARKRKDFREAEAKRKKLHGEEAMDSIVKKAKRKEGAECRAFLIGRCWNQSCRARHTSDPKTIKCCSRRFGTANFKPSKDKCPMTEDTCWFTEHMTAIEQELDMYGSAEKDDQMPEAEDEITHI